MAWIEIPAGLYAMGWRHDHALSPAARDGLDAFLPKEELAKAFSPASQVQLAAFAMDAEPLALSAFVRIEDLPVSDLDAVCDDIDQRLAAPTMMRRPFSYKQPHEQQRCLISSSNRRPGASTHPSPAEMLSFGWHGRTP